MDSVLDDNLSNNIKVDNNIITSTISEVRDIFDNYFEYDADDNIYRLIDDIILDKCINIKEDMTIDLNGKNIIGDSDNYIFNIENSNVKIINNDIRSNIFSKSKFPAINSINSEVFLENVNVYGFDGIVYREDVDDVYYDGSIALHIIDSNIDIKNSNIFGGNGKDGNNKKGGDGGYAIYLEFSSNDYSINIENSIIFGGNGGSGTNSNVVGIGANALIINEISQKLYIGNDFIYKNSNGDFGGGNGAAAIKIDGFFDLSNLILMLRVIF